MNNNNELTPTYVSSVEEWVTAVAEDNILEESAIALYGIYFDERTVGRLNPSIWTHIWRRFDTETWRRFCAERVQDALSAYKSPMETPTAELVHSCAAFWPVVKKCGNYLEKNYTPHSYSLFYTEKLGCLLDLYQHKYSNETNNLLCELAIGALPGRSDCEVLLELTDWNFCWVLPVPSLDSLFVSLSSDSRFAKGEPLDLKLCAAMADDVRSFSRTDLFELASGQAHPSDFVHQKVFDISSRSLDNRYWRYMRYALQATSDSGEWPTTFQNIFKRFTNSSENLSASDELLHIMQVVEETPGTHLPAWLTTLLANVAPGLSRSQLWTHMIPEYRQNNDTWDALGLTEKEKARACSDLRDKTRQHGSVVLPPNLAI